MSEFSAKPQNDIEESVEKPSLFRQRGTTLDRVVKADKADRIALEIGDSKEEAFFPQAKIMRWGNEVNFSVRRHREPALGMFARGASSPEVRTEEDRVIYEDGNEEVHIYELPAGPGMEDGGLEIELHLKEKPDTNSFVFSIETKGLDFHKQQKRESNEHFTVIQPENVIGSYAVYHQTKRDNFPSRHYKTGKAFHIYRPLVIDADGSEVWGELDIDVEEKTLVVTVPQEFLDEATYPVIVDPTIGYTSMGSSALGTGDVFTFATPVPSTQAGVLESVTIGYQNQYTPDSLGRGYIFNETRTSIVEASITPVAPISVLPPPGYRWIETPYVTKPVILSGVNYFLSALTNNTYVAFDEAGSGSLMAANGLTWPNISFDSPVDADLAAYEPVGNYLPSPLMTVSIYATYADEPTPPTAGKSALIKLNGSFTGA